MVEGTGTRFVGTLGVLPISNNLFSFILLPKILVSVGLIVTFLYIFNLSWKKNKRQSLHSALSFLPGPKGIPILGNIFEMSNFKDTISTLFRLAKTYGDCYHLRLYKTHFVFVTSGTVANNLLKSSKFGHTFKPTWATDKYLPYMKYGLGVANGIVHWKNERKLLSPTMSLHHIRGYLKPVIVSSSILVNELTKLFQDGQSHSVNELVNACVIMNTTGVVCGVPVFDLEECLEHHRSFKKFGNILQELMARPWLWFSFLYKRSLIYQERAKSEKILHAFAERRLDDVRMRRKTLDSNSDKEKCMIDALLDANIPEYLIMDEIKLLMAAGYETIGSSIMFTLWMLGLHMEHQNLCRKEVDDLYAQAGSDKFDLEHMNNLKYLDMCISETLRLFPVAYALLRELKEPLTIEYKGKERKIPEGVNVYVDVMAVHRNPSHYQNPDSFDPSRFGPEQIAQRAPNTFIPFSSGIRGCIGVVYAMAAMKMTLANLLRNFTWSTADNIESVRIVPGINIRPEHDIQFQFYRRVKPS